MQCGVCGATQFTESKVLWDELVHEWQISAEEVDYLNRQQGQCCNRCDSDLRSIALANAIRAFLGTALPLAQVAGSARTAEVRILEINRAGKLTRWLEKFGQHTFGAYPQVDMHAMPFPAESFDLVVHSDTLEHLTDPMRALAECRRVLKPNGALAFTVPIVVGRMTRDRAGLPKSFHGNSRTGADDMLVHTEFGADAWTYPMRAGFADVSIHSIGYPAATAMLARNGWACAQAEPVGAGGVPLSLVASAALRRRWRAWFKRR